VVFGPAESCGAVQKNCSVECAVGACGASDPAVFYAMGYAVSAKPTGQCSMNDGVGQRSGVRPSSAASGPRRVEGFVSVSRNAAVSGATPGPPELPRSLEGQAKTTAVETTTASGQKILGANLQTRGIADDAIRCLHRSCTKF